MIIGLTRVRNEAEIIQDTINHLYSFCDKVVVYDDCSTDNTRDLCKVDRIVRGVKWDKVRKRAEYTNRALLLQAGKQLATSKNDWFVYIDADERIEFDWAKLTPEIIGVRMKLFDYYITPEDVDAKYSERKYLGPEFRNILMAFKNLPTLDYSSNDQREVHLRSEGLVLNEGFVRHYGKAISVNEWEKTCDYYTDNFPKYAEKWSKRKGKAIHTQSSFGFPLITWEEKEAKGILLTKEIELKNIY